MSEEELFDEEFPILILIDEEGEEHEFELLAELEIEDEKYRVLVPFDDEEADEDEEEFEVVILKVVLDEEGNEFLSDIEDDEEWERVADAWQELAEGEDL
ncbi:MAG: DUF1292 domain-containing protein [Syntrophomonadaceae bacterium]|jgi:uncharacterized protein YrzB (UPF0473 family)|nr:DUF1292 domain-containing protein [Syntrophomonadaceae bacterium]